MVAAEEALLIVSAGIARLDGDDKAEIVRGVLLLTDTEAVI